MIIVPRLRRSALAVFWRLRSAIARTTVTCVVAAFGVISLAPSARAQAGMSYSVQLGVELWEHAPAIILHWPERDPQGVRGYTIQRRTPGATSWGDPIGDASSIFVYEDGRRGFFDPHVEAGKVYEYAVTRKFVVNGVTGETHQAYGYVTAGIRAPLVDRRGTLVLVVERGILEPLAAEIARLQNDLIGDGWGIARVEVDRHDPVPDVKARIKQVYEADPANVKAAFLLGRVPVPYSGTFLPSPPDGHGSVGDDHRGAWPADVYYADMDGKWTDETDQHINLGSARATNVPGDGKFDQSYLPSDVELQLGRVDLSSLPGERGARRLPDEVALLRQYLDRNHAYRHARLPVRARALVGDNNDPYGGRAYTASGYRNFATLVGAGQIVVASTEPGTPAEQRWLKRLVADSYLWVYGFGGGSSTSVAALGTRGPYSELWSSDLVEEGAQGVFHLLFGSWFGDWDQTDNLLRTALATRYGLAAAWSGRPHLVFHPMGLGETLGHGIRLSQNNADTYHNQINTFRRGVHIALLGDPTLRMYPVPPPTELQARRQEAAVALSWRAPEREGVGYHVYRAASAADHFQRLTETPLSRTDYVDAQAAGPGVVYLVRAVVLESTPSGSFFNASQGVFVGAP